MTKYSTLQSLFLTYDGQENKERGYDAAARDVAFEAVRAECARLSVSVTEGRRLAEGRGVTKNVEIAGPTYVLSGGRQIIQCESSEAMEAADPGFRYIHSFIPAGRSRSFAVAA